jgi:hypothetical protein
LFFIAPVILYVPTQIFIVGKEAGNQFLIPFFHVLPLLEHPVPERKSDADISDLSKGITDNVYAICTVLSIGIEHPSTRPVEEEFD